MHTSQVSACAVKTAAEQVYLYKSRGYTGIIVTDHFINGNSTCPHHTSWENKMKHFVSGYFEAKIAGFECGLDVFFGLEFSIKGSDFLTYGIDMNFLLSHPRLDKMDIESYSALVRKHGGYIAQAHPFREAWYIENKFAVEPKFLDGIEVYNSTDSYRDNDKAVVFAKKHKLPMQSGTDSHGSENFFYSGVKLGKKADSIFDIIDAIKAGSAKMMLP
jgi:hypothetical protein